VRLIAIAAASYATLFVILLSQGLRGQAVLNPDAATLGALAAWLAGTALAVWTTGFRRRLYPATTV
jgi:hypothetical protein